MSTAITNRKVAVIGSGFVGSACAFSLMESRLFSEMVLIDVDRDRAEGEALDISHGIPFFDPMTIYAGDYSDLADASIVVVTAGANQKPGESRLDLVQKNVAIFKSIISQITASGFNGVLLVVSNPVDILTHVALKLSGLPESQVLGSGTVLDSARLKHTLGEKLGVDPRQVHARIIGEHGDSEIALWSSSNIAGIPMDTFFALRGINNAKETMDEIAADVRDSAYEIIKKKRATYFGIASSVKRICECIVRDEKSIMTVSNHMHGMHGIEDIALSMPAIVGRTGVEYQLPIVLNEEENRRLQVSANMLRKILAEVEL